MAEAGVYPGIALPAHSAARFTRAPGGGRNGGVSMRMVLFGGTGQVGRALAETAGSFELLAPPRDQADLSRPESLAAVLAADSRTSSSMPPRIPRSTGPRTSPQAAFAVNRDGPAALARLCAAAGIPLIHLSTDYVFDGMKTGSLCRERRAGPVERLRRVEARGRDGGPPAERTPHHPALLVDIRAAWHEFRAQHSRPRCPRRGLAGRRRPARLPDARLGNRRRDHPARGTSGRAGATWPGAPIISRAAIRLRGSNSLARSSSAPARGWRRCRR